MLTSFFQMKELFTRISFHSDTLQAGETRNITHPIEIAGANSTGQHFVVAVVDENYRLSEVTKDNNESSIPVYIDDVSCYFIAYPSDRDTFPSIMTIGSRMRIPIHTENRCFWNAEVSESWMNMSYDITNESGNYDVFFGLQNNLSDTTRIGHVLVNGEVTYTAVQLGCDDSVTSNLAFVSNVQNVSCLGASDGMIDIEITGGYPPYTVQWSHLDQYSYWSTHTNPTSYNSLIPRNYTIIVSDQTGCIVSETITITEPTTLSSYLEGMVSNSCWGTNDGAIQINTEGGTPPYSYSWSNGANTEDITNITQGLYEVSITDANGCSYIQTHEVTSLSQHPLYIGDDTTACEFIDITAPSGLFYQWSTGETSQNIRIENSGSYSLIAQTPDGCTGFDTINIEVNQNVFPVSEQTKLTACDGVVQDQFGGGVAIDGNWAVVGAHYHDEIGSNAGTAYIFKYENGAWYQHSKLLAFDGYANDRFGKSVAIDGNTIVVGADEKTYNQLGRAGAAYIYDFDGTNWNFAQKITAPNPASSDYFGFSLDISDGYIVVGARYDDELGTNAGAAYVYKRINGSWLFEEKLLPSDGSSGDYFGYDVAIDQNNVIVGAHRNSEILSHGGAAYIYTFNGSSWIETKIITSDNKVGDYFGYSVDINGNTAVVGAYLVDNIYNNEGAVYVFEFSNDTWNETQKIHSNNPDSYFGWDVSFDENFLLISGGSNEGKAYVYQNNNNWIFDRLITAYDDEDNHDFARSLSISGERMIMGAVYASLQNGGAAYLSNVCQGISINHQPAETSVCINTPFSLSSSEPNTNWYDGNGDLLQTNSNTLNHIATEDIEIIMESMRGNSGCVVYDTLNIQTSSPQITNLPTQTKITSCSGGGSQRFGNAVDISGEWAIVGEKDNKAAHIWRKVNGQWEYGQRLSPQIPINAGYFGADVAIHGNIATVTSTYAYGNRYSELYIYEYNDIYWELSAKFNVPVTQYQNHFNGAVDIFDNTAVVGVRNSNGEDFVCVYEKINNEWQQIEILPAPDGTTAVNFAFSISVYESILAVGARSHTGTGATYIFRKSNGIWGFEELIKGSDTQAGDLFGHAVDVQGDLIVVGAPNAEDESLTNRVRHGVVYAFHYDKGIWQEKGRMIGDYDRDNHGVGSSVGVDGDMIVAGAFWGELAYDGDGIFLFQYDGVDWQKVEKIASEYTSGNDKFGNAVAIDNGEIIAASDLDDEIGTDAGAAEQPIFFQDAFQWKYTMNPTDRYVQAYLSK